MARNKRKQIDAGYYAVAFIDLMGQQEQLRALKSIPDPENAEEHAAFIEAVKKTYGAVREMRSSFNRFFGNYEASRRLPDGLPKEKRQLYKQMGSNPIRYHQFSDFLTAFLALRVDQGKKLPISGIYAIIGATATVSLTSLAAGQPIRGGIDIGVGIEIKHNEIYGAALARAYALESRVAKYPRVVIGPELMGWLKHLSESDETDELSRASKDLAKHTMGLLALDDDGCPFVDFIGPTVQQEMEASGSESGAEVVRRAYEFVLKSSKEFENSGETKIASKYSQLQRYMEPRLGLWGIKI